VPPLEVAAIIDQSVKADDVVAVNVALVDPAGIATAVGRSRNALGSVHPIVMIWPMTEGASSSTVKVTCVLGAGFVGDTENTTGTEEFRVRCNVLAPIKTALEITRARISGSLNGIRNRMSVTRFKVPTFLDVKYSGCQDFSKIETLPITHELFGPVEPELLMNR
jgi:hypothetical protein